MAVIFYENTHSLASFKPNNDDMKHTDKNRRTKEVRNERNSRASNVQVCYT
jgi:hypothetical protein